MWTLEDIETELQDFSRFLEDRQGKDNANVLKKMEQSIMNKLSALPVFGPREAMKLNTVLTSNSWPGNFEKSLSEKIEAVLCNDIAKSSSDFLQSLKPQKLNRLQAFLTGSDWEVISSTSKALWNKQQVIACRLKQLGIRSCAESTVRQAVAILLCQLTKLPDPDMQYDMVQEFKDCFASTPEPDTCLFSCLSSRIFSVFGVELQLYNVISSGRQQSCAHPIPR